jgi:hypothetical protein
MIKDLEKIMSKMPKICYKGSLDLFFNQYRFF